MRVGVLEILTDSVAHGWIVKTYDSRFRRQYASITPQAVAVWCRQLGHEVHYATYYGQGAPEALLPETWTSSSSPPTPRRARSPTPWRGSTARRGALTVLGGPHATSFPDGLPALLRPRRPRLRPGADRRRSCAATSSPAVGEPAAAR